MAYIIHSKQPNLRYYVVHAKVDSDFAHNESLEANMVDPIFE